MLVVTVPGLRGHVDDHWQTRLAEELPGVLPVPPLGNENPSLKDRIAALEETIWATGDKVILVAHSAGVLTTVHWARSHPAGKVAGALLVTPPVLANELPYGYPSLKTLWDNGWLPIPQEALPFPSIVAASTNDVLGEQVRVRELADAWGSRYHNLGAVGHLNPASGFGHWPEAKALIQQVMENQA